MQRFILQQNIQRFRSRIAETSNADDRRRLEGMRAAAERELALLDTALTGVQARPVLNSGPDEGSRLAAIAQFRSEFGASTKPAILIDPLPGLTIVDVNAPYEAVSGLKRGIMIGQPLFLLFPDNPDDPLADGVSHLYASLRLAAETGRPHAMPIQRYDVRDADGRFVERYWRPVNTPLHDEFGRLVYLLHQVEEVTDEALASRSPA